MEFSREVTRITLDQHASESKDLTELRVACWNIERGYLPKDLIKELAKLNADILLLQEVDWGNQRTGKINIAKTIAAGLELPHILYGVEFEEIYSPQRSEQLQGGGTHGNAIISRFPLSNEHLIVLPESHNWETSSTQPRRGGRMALACTVEVSQSLKIGCVTVHLENYCGPAARRNQFRYLCDQLSQIEEFPESILIGGDMNTIVGGLGRLYALNPLSLVDIWERIKSIGYSEAERWEIEMSDLVGPNGFCDPFDKDQGTISQVSGWYQPKLDWLMSRGLPPPVEKNIGGSTSGPIKTRLSDHKWLFAVFPLAMNEQR